MSFQIITVQPYSELVKMRLQRITELKSTIIYWNREAVHAVTQFKQLNELKIANDLCLMRESQYQENLLLVTNCLNYVIFQIQEITKKINFCEWEIQELELMINEDIFMNSLQ